MSGVCIPPNDDGDALEMDVFDYVYNDPINGGDNNRLSGLIDHAGASQFSNVDIDETITPDNYFYDEIGQLVRDVDENIENISWTVTNKVKEIRYFDGKVISFDYDAMGNRIAKHFSYEKERNSTYYILDAQGNQMAIYKHITDDPIGSGVKSLYLSERNIYGSSRIGQEQIYEIIASSKSDLVNINTKTQTVIGDKYFEMSNHLGNVLQVVLDRKLPVPDGVNNIDYFLADVRSYSDYYPGGMIMPGRSGNSNSYDYGFNGMLKDDEIKGEGNSYTTEFRQYDPRVFRWLSIDPLAKERAWLSPYNFVQNNPLNRIDPNGDLDDEYDKNGNKVSDLGGDKVDFHHQDNGDTKITDIASGISNTIKQGESLIKDYSHRDKNTSWSTLLNEWDKGIGVENSLLSDFDNTSQGFFGSMDGILSTYASKARSEVLSSNEPKGGVKFDYGETNPVTAGFDGWEQFLGRSTISYYKLGDKVLFLMTDSKTWESASYRVGDSWDRSQNSAGGTTRQTYIWTETMGEVRKKNHDRNNWIHRVQKTRKEYKGTESQRLPLIKY